MHFEDIWNECESIIANKLPKESLNDTVQSLKDKIEKINTSENNLNDEEKFNQSILIGEIIFDICKITDKYQIDSAAALKYVKDLIKC